MVKSMTYYLNDPSCFMGVYKAVQGCLKPELSMGETLGERLGEWLGERGWVRGLVRDRVIGNML